MDGFIVKVTFFVIISNALISVGECFEKIAPIPSDNHVKDDDLVKAFSHLDFESLIDVSEINEKFHQIIAENFIAGYHLDRNVIHLKGVTAKAPASAIREKYPNQLTIENSKLISKVLENFGYLMRNIEIDGSEADYLCLERIVDMVEKYCAKTLTSLTLSRMERMVIGKWRPFERVEKVTIDAVELYKDVPLYSIFPNLRALNLYPLARTKLSSILHPYPHIEHLGIYTASSHTNQDFVKSFVQLNPNLTSLTIADAISTSYAEYLRDNFPHLKALRLIALSSEFFFEEPRKIIYLRNVTNFSMTILKNSNQTIMFPFAFNELKALTLDVATTLPDNLIEAIVENNQLEKLAIIKVIPTYQQLKRIVAALPKLKEIYLTYNCRAIESISKLMNDKTSLEFIHIHYPLYQLHHQAFHSVRSPFWEYSGEVEHQSVTYASFKWRK